LITIEKSQPLAEAIALRDGLIQAVGTNTEILALQGTDTQIIDLQGRTMMPGFIDGHTHVLAFPGRMGKSLDEAQDIALRYGFTSVSEMWANEDLVNSFLAAESHGNLRLRVNVFPSYNDGILGSNRERILMETWYPAHAPILDPERLVRIPGIKIFVDGDNANYERGCWALSEPFEADAPLIWRGVCGTNQGDLYWSQDELNRVVQQAQQAGYRVAFHAMGDRAIETALNAIEYALDGASNETVRHQIEHNSLTRTDQLQRYSTLDVAASVRGYGITWCDLETLKTPFGEDRYLWYLNRFALAGMNIHAYNETDFGWTVDPEDRFAVRGLDPMVQLYGIVTHNFMMPDGTLCEPGPSAPELPIPIERALQMLTIEPAYAVSMEEYIGSLKAGKYADLILLSGNPLEVDSGELKDLQVWMTMVAGKVEYCATGQEALCPGEQAAENLPSSGNLALNRTVAASMSLQFSPDGAVDGDESTAWGAGDFAPQWIEVDLGAPATITEIRLLAGQSPDGDTQHRILAGETRDDLTKIHLFDQFTHDREWLVYQLREPLEDIQFVRVETLASPSWVAWLEVQVFGTR
jgi:predicted amidohydrolase YtcJ